MIVKKIISTFALTILSISGFTQTIRIGKTKLNSSTDQVQLKTVKGCRETHLTIHCYLR